MRRPNIIELALLLSLPLLLPTSVSAQRLFQWVPNRPHRGCLSCFGRQTVCPCPSCVQTAPGVGQTFSDVESPSDQTDPADPTQGGTAPSDSALDDSFALSSQFGGGTGTLGARDVTIGDFFGTSGFLDGPTWGLANNPVAAGDRRHKVSDHFNPLPGNRYFFSYHGFTDAVTDVNGNVFNVQRYTFGLERTFWNNMASIEVRLPFANGLNSSQRQSAFGSPPVTLDGTEFGNMSVATKLLLYQQCNWSLAGGVAATLPTASDAELFAAGSSTPSVIIDNEAWYLIPFWAVHIKPQQNSWITLTNQIDFNMQGQAVTSFNTGQSPVTEIYNDQHLLSFDISAGRWFRYNPDSCRLIRGVAGILELHYSTTINDTDFVQAGTTADELSNPFNRLDVLNLTSGARFLVRDRTYATFAGVLPLREGGDRPFDAEINFNLTRNY